MCSHLHALKDFDPAIYNAIIGEEKRQFNSIRLIPSENYVSDAVLDASGSILTNKYSEGYAKKRYYEGQEFVDDIETLAIERAKELFGADHANVQPYSGSPANAAVFYALLKKGEKIMGLNLLEGGHLTHGWKANMSARFYESVSYHVDKDTHMLDYDALAEHVKQEKPKLIIAGYTAYPRIVDFEKFREIADSVGAYLLADISHINGLIVGGVHPNPVPYADVVSSTSHKAIRGPRGGFILSKKEHAKAIDRAIIPGLQGGPHNHTTAGIAVAFKEAMQPEFKEYAAQVVANAKHLADKLMEKGFVLVTGGTDNHLMVINTIASHDVPGKIMSEAMAKAGIVSNYNMVPFDERSPMDPSGVRLGTPAVTTRGFKEAEMDMIADWMHQVIQDPSNEQNLAKIHAEVEELCGKFPCPGIHPTDW
jgi:glycine hydroxymethyltransferase